MAQMLDPEAPEGANEIRSPSFSKVSAVGVKVAVSPAPALATGMVHGSAVYSNRDRAVGRGEGAIGYCINARDLRCRRSACWSRRRHA